MKSTPSEIIETLLLSMYSRVEHRELNKWMKLKLPQKCKCFKILQPSVKQFSEKMWIFTKVSIFQNPLDELFIRFIQITKFDVWCPKVQYCLFSKIKWPVLQRAPANSPFSPSVLVLYELSRVKTQTCCQAVDLFSIFVSVCVFTRRNLFLYTVIM